MLTAFSGIRARLINGNMTCGMWELYLSGSNEAHLEDLKKDFKAMKATAHCSDMPGATGLKGAGIILVNLVVPPEAGVKPAGDQSGLTKFLIELGFRRVKTYKNPRSGKTLRLYYITGAELHAAL